MKSSIGQDIIARSFSVGSDSLSRVMAGTELPVEVTFRGALSEAVLCTEIQVGSRVVRGSVTMERATRHFRAKVACTSPGVMRFKVRYRIGDDWYWDHVPYCYVMVDDARLDRVRMYTLIPNASGTVRDWTALLPSIAGMGFNMVHLLPITRMGVSQSPYAAYDLFTLDPRYLDPGDPRSGHEQFAGFVAELKRHGLGLCVDLVFNHIGVDSEVTEQHPAWLSEDPHEQDGIKRAGFQGAESFHRWEDLGLLDYEPFDPSQGRRLWATMLRYGLYWADFAAETDGMLRLDNLHSSHRPFLNWAMACIRSRHPRLMVLGELFTDESTIRRVTREMGVHLVLATQWEHKFVPELRGYLEYLHKVSRRVRHFFPISSHDSGVPAEEYGDVRSTVPRLVVSILLGPGPTGLVQGVEHGVREPVRFIGGRSEVMVSPGIDFAPLVRQLFDLVDAHPALRAPGNLAFFDAGHGAILAGARFEPGTERAAVLVCINLDIGAAQTLHCSLVSVAPEGTCFREVRSGELLRSGQVDLTLEPGGYRVYVRSD